MLRGEMEGEEKMGKREKRVGEEWVGVGVGKMGVDLNEDVELAGHVEGAEFVMLMEEEEVEAEVE